MMTKIRARFTCTTVTRHVGDPDGLCPEEVCLVPVSRHDSGDNVDWSKYTPSGELRMYINAAGAVGKIQPGQDYYVDLTLVEG